MKTKKSRCCIDVARLLPLAAPAGEELVVEVLVVVLVLVVVVFMIVVVFGKRSREGNLQPKF